jgi:quercetin dioxygenase-like cupin family protein
MTKQWNAVVAACALALGVLGPVFAGGTPAVVAKADLEWSDAGIPGVRTAAVEGDMAKGPSHFYLSYPAGFVAPRHHHSPDHYVTTLSGSLVLVVEGRDVRLAPGSFFAFTGKAAHAVRCEGTEACVMFIDARGAWDVVPEKP